LVAFSSAKLIIVSIFSLKFDVSQVSDHLPVSQNDQSYRDVDDLPTLTKVQIPAASSALTQLFPQNMSIAKRTTIAIMDLFYQ
jgi:hypothetical protein